jgi:hypothetical protein
MKVGRERMLRNRIGSLRRDGGGGKCVKASRMAAQTGNTGSMR